MSKQFPSYLLDATLSWGTLRNQDLIPKLLLILKEIDTDRGLKYEENNLQNISEITDDWWDSYEACETLEELFDIINSMSPEGYYFGSNPGDGADFGFWKIED